jgi:hypothetical protein
MNNKIKELAEESGYIPDSSTEEAFNEFRIEKFARLIAQECLDTIEDIKNYNIPIDAVNEVLEMAQRNIIDDFGMKNEQK